MPLLIRNIHAAVDADHQTLVKCVQLFLGGTACIQTLQVVRKAIDARKKHNIIGVYTLLADVVDEDLLCKNLPQSPHWERVTAASPVCFVPRAMDERVIIVGMGPAGMFCALRLMAHGIPSTILERGRAVHERVQDVSAFWRNGLLNQESNVQFGEGGAGTFSDGKLTCRVRDPNSSWVLDQLVRYGAPQEIRYQAKPHIGTDRLRSVVTCLREHLVAQGCEVHFNSRVDDILMEAGAVRGVLIADGRELLCQRLVLAIGHSARDSYRMLFDHGVVMESKPFAIGVRVEHPQSVINTIQYGIATHPQLGSAEYALTWNDVMSGRSCYSFCMCPGGLVIAGSSEEGMVVTNGMSNHARSSGFANSALVVSVRPSDFDGKDVLGGVRFQQDLERRAFHAAGTSYAAPVQNMMDFLKKQKGSATSSYQPGTTPCELRSMLPPFITQTLVDGIACFDKKMRGFKTVEASLTAVETRTSAPVRIVRGENHESLSHAKLYPCGEGAGYAGGIMSAALDGIRIADTIAATAPLRT